MKQMLALGARPWRSRDRAASAGTGRADRAAARAPELGSCAGGRHDVAHHKLSASGAIVDAADAREVRLHEAAATRASPRREVADGVEPPVERVRRVLHRPRPRRTTRPRRSRAAGLPDVGVIEVEHRHARERGDDARADVMQVAQLLRHDKQRPQHHAHRLEHALSLVGEVVRAHVVGEPPRHDVELGVCDVIDRAPHARVENRAGEAERFGRREDLRCAQTGHGGRIIGRAKSAPHANLAARDCVCR